MWTDDQSWIVIPSDSQLWNYQVPVEYAMGSHATLEATMFVNVHLLTQMYYKIYKLIKGFDFEN